MLSRRAGIGFWIGTAGGVDAAAPARREPLVIRVRRAQELGDCPAVPNRRLPYICKQIYPTLNYVAKHSLLPL